MWSVGVGCQPLCVCKTLENASWICADTSFVCILQFFSLGPTSPLPLLMILNAIKSVALPVFLSGILSHCGSHLLKEVPDTSMSFTHHFRMQLFHRIRFPLHHLFFSRCMSFCRKSILTRSKSKKGVCANPC